MGLLSKCAVVVVTFVPLIEAIASAEQTTRPDTPISGDRKIELAIPAQPLPRALKALGDEFDLIVLFGDDVGDGIAPELQGAYTVNEALKRLLKNTGLDFKYVDAATITIKNSAKAGSSGPARVPAAQDVSRKSSFHRHTTADTPESDDAGVDYVVVTGSRLKDREAAGSSAQRVYDQDALQQSGAATLAEVSQLLPETFNSVSPVSSLYGNTVGVPQLGNNVFLGSGFNLSGLGPEATLTLLDGDRWVSGGASGTFFDLSVLPMNAVASIVTLAGDSSAVYGSDAIAGVVNILSRSGSDGSETRVRYGTTSDGGGGQWIFSQRLGESWQGGDGMIAYQRMQQRPVLSTARSYIPAVIPVIDIVPRQSSSGLLGKLEHQLAQDTTVTAHFLYGARDVAAGSSGFLGYLLKRDSPAEEYGGTVHIDHRLTPEWTVGLYGSYSTLAQSLSVMVPGASLEQPGNSSLGELALSANAEPIRLYGHPLSVAFGAGARRETLTVPSSPYRTSYTSIARKVGDVYVETFLPLINGYYTLLKRLELSLVAREDYYQAVGPTLNPKAGLVWSPGSDLNFRATFARSFRPPTLDELAAIPFYYTVNIPDRHSLTGATDTLIDQSQGLSRLVAETSRTITGGIDYHRDGSQGLGGSVTWFRTVFDNRVATPLAGAAGPTPTDVFAQPALAPYVSRSIEPAQILAIFSSPGFAQDFAGGGPAGVEATFDNQLINIARTFEEGLGASLRYSNGEQSPRFTAFAIANYLLRDTYRFTPGAPTISLVNNVGQPPSLRARGGMSLSWNDWRTTLNVNYTSSYRNTLVSPAPAVSSWTTLDFGVGWRLAVFGVPVQTVELNFNAQNLLNAAPPRVEVPAGLQLRAVGFDAANASALGRRLSLEVAVAW